MMRKRPANLPSRSQPRVIIGFDSEWVVDGPLNKMLSYQIIVLNADTGRTSESYFPLDGRTSRRPKDLGWLLAQALRQAIVDRVIQIYPDKLILAAHFTRADLTALKDFVEIKSGLTALRKTYATTSIRLVVTIATPQGAKKINITVADTMLLSPGKTSLDKLGETLGIPKVKLPKGYTKDRMDLFQADQPEQFRAYAMTDARIAALWADRILKVMDSLNIKKPVATLAGAAVELAAREIKKHENLATFLGKAKARYGRPQPMANISELWGHSAQCYHGGLNTTFAYGFSPEGQDLTDIDVKSAYSTALAMAQIPNWESADRTTDINDLAVVDEAMTYIHANFKFPAGSWPCLPIRASKSRGLIYPLAGETWCCGPELVVALSLGCEIEILKGWRVDWKPGGVRPLEEYIREINQRRAEATALGDAIKGMILKEIGNSGYGKFSQAVASFRTIKDDVVYRPTFDTHWQVSDHLGPSRITQPMIAAFVTSIVRAVVSEAVNRLPSKMWVGTMTTDGFLFAGALSDIDETGPVATAFKNARERITPDNPAMWDLKCTIPRALVARTRCAYTHAPAIWDGKVVLARSGGRLPINEDETGERIDLSDLQECAEWIKRFRDRDFDTKIELRSLTSLRDQHIKGMALQEVIRQVTWNVDPDLKNRPINVRDEDGLFTADTEPWATIDEFEQARDHLKKFRESRVIKTAQDYFDFENWRASLASRRAVNARSGGKLPTLARAVAIAALHGACGVKRIGDRGTDALAATLSHLTGTTVTKTNVKDIRRRGVGPEKLAGSVNHLTQGDIDFAADLMTGTLSAIHCLTMICTGESAELQLIEAWRRACNALGAVDVEPEQIEQTIDAPLRAPGVSALAIRFVSSEFQDNAGTLGDARNEALEGQTQLQSGIKEHLQNTGIWAKKAHRSNFCKIDKKAESAVAPLPLISTT
jgi:DNA polymerase type B, organellar and viral